MNSVLKDALENAIDNYNEIMGSIDTTSGSGYRAKLLAIQEIETCYQALVRGGALVSIVDVDAFTKKVRYG